VKVALAQLNTRVGAIDANSESLISAARRARDELKCELAIFPELTLCGYPPEDLLLHRGLRNRVAVAVQRIRSEIDGIAVCFGLPEYHDDDIFNSAMVLSEGSSVALHRKWVLPNYAVFDEKRYFESGTEPTIFDLEGIRFGLIICEDAWKATPCRAAVDAGAEVVIVINGSPFHTEQGRVREDTIRARAAENGTPVIYLNMVGGQDELVFDGGSFVVDAAGEVIFRAAQFAEDIYVIDVERRGKRVEVLPQPVAPVLSEVASVYEALKLATRDYVDKNGFPGVILGLSGGIDSALTLSVAADALGSDRVLAVMMPSEFTSAMSLQDSAEQAKLLGVRHEVLPIGPIFDAIRDTLAGLFSGLAPDATEENIQARCRGVLLMGISNKLGSMLLTTGNKSEMAVGYATLYGDMAGGFAPLKDCSKTLVYALARYRNELSPSIPSRVISREPSAELAPDQKDSDSLPPYQILDAILEAFIEQDQSVEQITAQGFERETVVRILQMVKRAEYKRRQAPPGVRVSQRAFGRDWRYPITSGY
jgi:NAD+ synthase (glutamine-hydrolysing)